MPASNVKGGQYQAEAYDQRSKLKVGLSQMVEKITNVAIWYQSLLMMIWWDKRHQEKQMRIRI